jgi:excisionase family DNA binding protein
MKILTVKEVSALLKVEPSTVYSWAEQRKIPCCKINGALRFVETDVLAWLAASCKLPVEAYNSSRR